MRLLLVPERSVPAAALFPQDAADLKPPATRRECTVEPAAAGLSVHPRRPDVALAWTPDGNPIRVLILAAYLYFL
jgi:hypothetical protein